MWFGVEDFVHWVTVSAPTRPEGTPRPQVEGSAFKPKMKPDLRDLQAAVMICKVPTARAFGGTCSADEQESRRLMRSLDGHRGDVSNSRPREKGRG